MLYPFVGAMKGMVVLSVADGRQRRYDVCHDMLTQRALFALTPIQKGHAESAIRDACRTSSG